MMNQRTLSWTVFLVVLIAVAISAPELYQKFSDRPKMPLPFMYTIKDWREYKSGFHRIGPQNAPVTIVMFSDYECGYCIATHTALEKLQEKYRSTLAVIYRHFPLDGNLVSRSAAVAATCAQHYGRFPAFNSMMFQDRELVASESWGEIAAASGIRDTLSFNRCVQDSTYVQKVDDDLEAGYKLGVVGTPTLLLNQLRIDGYAGYVLLDSLISNEISH